MSLAVRARGCHEVVPLALALARARVFNKRAENPA